MYFGCIPLLKLKQHRYISKELIQNHYSMNEELPQHTASDPVQMTHISTPRLLNFRDTVFGMLPYTAVTLDISISKHRPS